MKNVRALSKITVRAKAIGSGAASAAMPAIQRARRPKRRPANQAVSAAVAKAKTSAGRRAPGLRARRRGRGGGEGEDQRGEAGRGLTGAQQALGEGIGGEEQDRLVEVGQAVEPR